ncbi:hypothetical protein B0H13DRAFT_2679484 [Mycena leptocephala]|nr:hypothetical protein B0H13DRAFT_2679484 [Mycena leptocephala]
MAPPIPHTPCGASSAPPASTGFNVFAQTDLAAPNAAIELVLYQVDQLSDSLADMTATMEMVNNARGASVGAQTFLRANFTSTSARNAGTFTEYSEEFYIKGANPPKCLILAEVTPALNLTNAQSGMATGGLCALPFGLWVLVCVVLCPLAAMLGI